MPRYCAIIGEARAASGGRAESPVASPVAGGAALVAWFIGEA